jgi:hypothetical protein
LAPIPRKKVGEVPGRVIIDAGEHVSDPGLRVNAVELRVPISEWITAVRSPARSDGAPCAA